MSTQAGYPRRILIGIVLVLSLGAPRAAAREPLDLVPAESLLVWSGRPLPDTTPASGQPSTLQTLLELGTRVTGRQLDSGTQLSVRMAEMFGLTIRYPHVLALIDARAKPLENDPQARRVDKLRFALIVQNAGQATPFLRIIQKAVNEQTDSASAELRVRKVNQYTYQELHDQRLPAWSVIAWGHIDDCFVLTVGADVWADVAAAAIGTQPSISREPWYAAARMQRKRNALIEIFVSSKGIRARLDPFVQGRASAFFAAWDAERVQQAYWALGFEGRALFCEASLNMGRSTFQRLYADPHNRTPYLLATVPEEARYAIYELPVDRFLSRFFRGLLSIQGAKPQRNIERAWRDILERTGVDPQQDILRHLGPHVVLHNDPPHPLRIPLAMTTLIEIRDDPAGVRAAVNKLCAGWRDVIQEATADAEQPPDITIHQMGDDMWCLRFGFLDGLAWTVTDRFIVSSWSPRALRRYLEKMGPEVFARPTE